MVDKIPTKWLLFFLIIVISFVGFAVVFQDKPLDLWGMKVGESNDQLRQQLLQARQDLESTVPIEKYQDAQTKLKQEASKNLQLVGERARLKKQLQQANAKLKAAKGVTVEVRKLRTRAKQLTKQLEEIRSVLETTKRQLTSSIEQNRKLTVEVNKLNKALALISKNKLRAYSQQLADLEKKASSVNRLNKAGLVTAFNTIVKSLKADLRQDSFVRNLSGINSKAPFIIIGPYLKNQSSQIRQYLNETYLK